jgi:excisionase family DNA binding protein
MAEPASILDRPIAVNGHQLAKQMGVCQRTISRWRASEGLPFTKIGQVILFRPAAVEKWLAAREVVGAEVAR